jgi:hypothetical protein
MLEKQIVSNSFNHNRKNCDVKIFQVGNNYIIKSYLNGVEINSYSCPVLDITNRKDWEYHYGDKPPYVRLMEIAIDDIEKGNGLKKP